MNWDVVLETVGYVASILCMVSLMMSDIKKLRWVNLVASTMFGAYSIIRHAYPVALTNICIVLINIYYLTKIYKEESRGIRNVA